MYELCVEKGVISNDYYQELKNEKRQRVEEGMRVFSDIVPPKKVILLKKELDALSYRKIGLTRKMQWLGYNCVMNPKAAINGMWWVLNRTFQSRFRKLSERWSSLQ